MRDDERAIEDNDRPDSLPDDQAGDDDLVESYGEAADQAEFADETDDDALAEGDAMTELDAEAPSLEAARDPSFVAPVFNNFMDVLYPASPPAAKNARIVR